MQTTREGLYITISHPHYPKAKRLAMEDVFGYRDANFESIDNGMIIATGKSQNENEQTKQFATKLNGRKILPLPNICPIWKDELPLKSVTVVCDRELFEEVAYWLEYVHGAHCISRVQPLENNQIAIRSDYKCW